MLSNWSCCCCVITALLFFGCPDLLFVDPFILMKRIRNRGWLRRKYVEEYIIISSTTHRHRHRHRHTHTHTLNNHPWRWKNFKKEKVHLNICLLIQQTGRMGHTARPALYFIRTKHSTHIPLISARPPRPINVNHNDSITGRPIRIPLLTLEHFFRTSN